MSNKSSRKEKLLFTREFQFLLHINKKLNSLKEMQYKMGKKQILLVKIISNETRMKELLHIRESSWLLCPKMATKRRKSPSHIDEISVFDLLSFSYFLLNLKISKSEVKLDPNNNLISQSMMSKTKSSMP